MRLSEDSEAATARTDWRLVGVDGKGHSLVEFEMHEGRTHQIRVHAAGMLNCPIVGDPIYGPNGQLRSLGVWEKRLQGNWPEVIGKPQLLHASEISIQGVETPIHARLPPTFSRFWIELFLGQNH